MRFGVYNPIALTPLALLRSVTKCLTKNAKLYSAPFRRHFNIAFGESLTEEIHSAPSTGQLFFQ